jgi:hypothetical protein
MSIMEDGIRRLRKRALSREKVEDLRRIALSLPDGSDDQLLVQRAADFCADARTTLRGGRDEIRVRHWNK